MHPFSEEGTAPLQTHPSTSRVPPTLDTPLLQTDCHPWFEYSSVGFSGGLMSDPQSEVVGWKFWLFHYQVTTMGKFFTHAWSSITKQYNLVMAVKVISLAGSYNRPMPSLWLILVTHDQESCTRYLRMCHTFLRKFFSSESFLQLYSAQETCMHVTKIMTFDWPTVFSAGIVHLMHWQPYLLCTYLAGTCINLHKPLVQDSWACVTH